MTGGLVGYEGSEGENMSSVIMRPVVILFSSLMLFLTSYPASAIIPDAPHNNMGCLSCHDMAAYDKPNLIPDEGHVQLDDDNT